MLLSHASSLRTIVESTLRAVTLSTYINVGRGVSMRGVVLDEYMGRVEWWQWYQDSHVHSFRYEPLCATRAWFITWIFSRVTINARRSRPSLAPWSGDSSPLCTHTCMLDIVCARIAVPLLV